MNTGADISSVIIENNIWTGRPWFNSWQGQSWDLLLRHRVQTGSGVHPTSYPISTRGYFPGGKTSGM
jgi:hypothetical protein